MKSQMMIMTGNAGMCQEVTNNVSFFIQIDPNKDVGLEINAEATECMFMSHEQSTGQNRNIKIINRCGRV